MGGGKRPGAGRPTGTESEITKKARELWTNNKLAILQKGISEVLCKKPNTKILALFIAKILRETSLTELEELMQKQTIQERLDGQDVVEVLAEFASYAQDRDKSLVKVHRN